MAAQDHLRGYDVHWHGPYGHESRQKAYSLNVLSGHISRVFREKKAITNPKIHSVQIVFNEDPEPLHLHARHPKTNWLLWNRDYRDLETLSASADNATIGEYSIDIVHDLQSKIRSNPELVSDFPFDTMDEAIKQFRSEGYSISGRLGRTRKIDASPITARLSLHMTCLKTTVSVGFYLKRKELHRRELISFGGGEWDLARSLGGIHAYDSELSLFCVDMTQPPPIIKYDDLPGEVRNHLPSNAELEKVWETSRDPMENFLSGV